MTHVLIAADSFKGTADSQTVATQLAQGWNQVRPNDQVGLVVMADGGEGTLEAFWAANSADSTRMPLAVVGPDNQRLNSEWLLLNNGNAVVELGNSSGITHLERLDVFGAHSHGFGEVLKAAIDQGAKHVFAAIGGSASTDGGAGMLMALGAKLLDADGKPIPYGNAGLAQLHSVDLSGVAELPSHGITVLSDVRNPLLGPEGAAHVFGEQKGAQSEDFDTLEANLRHFASFFDLDPDTPGAGAAGGCGFGLLAIGAQLTAGSKAVAEAIGLPDAIAQSDYVITGEGRYDSQSGYGKVAAEVLQLAQDAGTDCALVAGQIRAEPTGYTQAVSLTDLAGSAEAAMAETQSWLVAAGRTLAEGYAVAAG